MQTRHDEIIHLAQERSGSWLETPLLVVVILATMRSSLLSAEIIGGSHLLTSWLCRIRWIVRLVNTYS